MIGDRRQLRNRLDAISQILFSANLITDALPTLWTKDPDKALLRLEQIHRLNRSALAEIQTLLLELDPVRLLNFRLDDLLQQLVKSMLGQIHVDVILDIQSDLDPSADIHLAAYYIAYEALNNIVRHAQADTAAITCRTQDDSVVLRVRDDGRGFDLAAISGARIGLDHMHKYADESDGQLRINTQPDEGTEIVIRWHR